MTEIHQMEMDAVQVEVPKLGLLDLVDPQLLLMFEVILVGMVNIIHLLLHFEMTETQ